MKKEFTLAFNEVLDAKQLPPDVVVEAIEAAMVSAYRKAVNASSAQQVVAKIDAVTLDDVARLAKRLFISKPSLTALGPIAQVMEYDALVGRLS